ncbi:MAG: hypothetical protein CMA62_00490 [Euryarchaeota archaeon]|nr:hypothetical protein [Euryarchaeota archaeon]MBT85988.1 hypothetical protein [Euryarchaeota archaeon]DAC47081.1 MAG TPA: hypothetical protein D7H82_02570 [Candidatus Poseidoniales archaeon]HII33766.1 hypothetical protein [Candidatus Thalassarchaeaceae archaeon]|tara:strand:- start:186 stop:482 length:297 start_codon:yes stop_codon:yes gene_type:complete
MGAAKTVIKTVVVILGILLILGSFGALVAADEIDSRVSEDCEDTVGSIAEIVGADEEQCQDARDLRDNLRSAFLPLIISGVSLVLIPILPSFMNMKSE